MKKMANKKMKVPISERALLARINRKLAHEGEQVRKKRSAWSAWGGAGYYAGAYYSIDLNRNLILADDIDLESWGKELGVLKPYERLAE